MILKETITREVEFDNKQEIREWSTRMKKIGYCICWRIKSYSNINQ